VQSKPGWRYLPKFNRTEFANLRFSYNFLNTWQILQENYPKFTWCSK
jgi:hypothetical protein